MKLTIHNVEIEIGEVENSDLDKLKHIFPHGQLSPTENTVLNSGQATKNN